MPLIPVPESTEPGPNQPIWLHWLDSCPSTNTWADTHATQLHHGDAVFTRRQTAGRGQNGRTWFSPSGVLTVSFVLDNLNPNLLPGFSLAVGLAVIYAIEDLAPDCRDMLRLKWPNDVWIHRRKLAGILCEVTSGNTAGSSRAIVGIGINRCADFDRTIEDVGAIGNAVSLHSISSKVPDEQSLIAKLRQYLLELAHLFSRSDKPESKLGLALMLPELRRRDALMGCDVAIELSSETILGQAAGIDKGGRLLLRLPDKTVRPFTSGRVCYQSLITNN